MRMARPDGGILVVDERLLHQCEKKKHPSKNKIG